MAATGNITEDLQTIHELVRPGTYAFDVYERDGLFPWSPPATEEDIESARSRMPGLPDEVVEIFRVSANVVAGVLQFQDGLSRMTPYDRSLTLDSTGFGIGFLPSDSLDTNRTVEDDNGWIPDDGDLLFIGRDLAVPARGPHQGVVYVGAFGGLQRAAWRLSDVVACTRELYENGWYEYWDISGVQNTGERYNELYGELVVPTIERWHCSPRIARLMHHIEPSRPFDL